LATSASATRKVSNVNTATLIGVVSLVAVNAGFELEFNKGH